LAKFIFCCRNRPGSEAVAHYHGLLAP
jgi:hypothetical protein